MAALEKHRATGNVDQLTDALRHLDPPPPPSSVDLDAVVRRAHRHQRRVRVFAAALPGASLLDATTCEPGFAFHAGGGRYTAAIIVVDGEGVSHLDVRVCLTQAEHLTL